MTDQEIKLLQNVFETGFICGEQGQTLDEAKDLFKPVLAKLCGHPVQNTENIGDDEHQVIVCSRCETILN